MASTFAVLGGKQYKRRRKAVFAIAVQLENLWRDECRLLEKHQNAPYDKSKEMTKNSHDKIMPLIEKFTEVELFKKKHFKWTGTASF